MKVFRKDNWTFTAEFFLILMTIIWGGTFISIKLALETVNPFHFLFIRFGLATLVTLILYLPQRNQFHMHSLLHGLWVGVVLWSGYFFQTWGLVDTSATKSGFITGAYVIITPVLEAIFLRKKPTIRVWIAVLIVFIGIFLISTDSESNITNLNLSKGDALTLAGAVGFSLYIVVIDRVSRIANETSLMVGQMVSAFIVSGIILGILGGIVGGIGNLSEGGLFSIRPGGWGLWGIFYTGVVATIVPTLVQTRYQKAVTPTKAGIIFSLEPVFASLFAFLVGGEMLGVVGFAGCGFIFMGILLSLQKDKEKLAV